MEEMILSCGR